MLPDLSNVYGVIYSPLSKEEIAKSFGKVGWNVRKADWINWEITNDFSELIIEGDKEILIHGPVSVDSFEIFVAKMKEIKLKFSLELYDEQENLISEVNNE